MVYVEGVANFGPWKYPESDEDQGHMTDGQTFSCTVITQNRDLLKQTRLKIHFQACNESVCLPPKTVELELETAKVSDTPLDNGPRKIVVEGELDVLNKPINNLEIYRFVLTSAQKSIAEPGHPGFDELQRQLKRARGGANIPVPSTALPDQDAVYESMVHASLIVASVYDCGKCDKQHVNSAGGVVVSTDGLVLTNYHVVDKPSQETLGMVVVTSKGTVHPVAEILSASESQDVALIRVGGDTSQLHPAPIATLRPDPMTPLFVISHPHREYFVLTEGRVSRYVMDPRKNGQVGSWMETTADFGAGSSGSAVFNEAGEVVGLVSRVFPLIRKAEAPDDHPAESGTDSVPPKSGRGDLLEMLLHRCVPLNAIRERFSESGE
jgi:hypothetical protein